MANSPLPSPEHLRQLLRYDPETGFVYWRTSGSGRCQNGRAMAQPHIEGYLVGVAVGQKMLTHRVVWALHHGEWPNGQIDHINGDRQDNRLSNLRVVSHSGNQRNRKLNKDNKSGVSGVRWIAAIGRWHVTVRKLYVGRFKTFEDAVAARKDAEKAHGFHPNHGRACAGGQSVAQDGLPHGIAA